MRQVFIIYDSKVSAYAAKVLERTPNVCGALAVEACEENKSMETVLSLCRFLSATGADRESLVIAIGGGVVCDVAGFAAGIYMRGIAYANYPTTLLAMVDAAIGGKNGVNLDAYKNMLGTFNFPEFTRISLEPLKTLPRREWLSGAAEMLKTFIIADAQNYEKAVRVLGGILSEPDPSKAMRRYGRELKVLIEASLAIKRAVVAADPMERGQRRTLNLGHTFGHAIEWWQSSGAQAVGNPLTHGEAVSAGIIKAARISEDLGLAKPGLAGKLEADFKSIGLPVELPCSESELAGAIAKDKKAGAGGLRMVLIRRIGRVCVKTVA